MGLSLLIFGLIVFLGAHVFVTCRGLRAATIQHLGEGPYKLQFSVVSAIGLVLIVWGFAMYRAHGWVDVWYPPVWTKHLAAALVWPAIICVVAAYIPGRIKTTLKHPMLVGVKLWATAHLIANGDLGSILLFGSFLGWAVYARITLKRRTDPSGLPIPNGGVRNDIIAVVVGTLVYVALGLWFHPWVIGVPVFGR